MTEVEVRSWVVTRAGEVVGVTWYEVGFERLRDKGLDGKEELLEVRVPSMGLSVVTMCSDVAVLLFVNWPFWFHTQGVHSRWNCWDQWYGWYICCDLITGFSGC